MSGSRKEKATKEGKTAQKARVVVGGHTHMSHEGTEKDRQEEAILASRTKLLRVKRSKNSKGSIGILRNFRGVGRR